MVNKQFVFLFAIIFLVLISISFVFTEHATSPATFTTNQSQNYFFNITLNNTNVAPGNITQVNITLWGNFNFTLDTNGTNLFGTFSNTSTVLSWINTTSFLSNQTTLNSSYFWFNATANSISGRYNITVTSVNETGIFSTNISVRVMDTSAPVITLISPTNGNSTVNAPTVSFVFNVTDSSSDRTANCSLILNGNKINFNSSVNISGGQNVFTNISYTVNNVWNVSCADSDNNIANSSTQTFSFVSFGFN